MERLKKNILKAHERMPASFEELLDVQGVGPKTIRALILVSDLVYGESPSFDDPARYSFAHGGKDGHPYWVTQDELRKTIEVLQSTVKIAKVGQSEKLKALQRLNQRFGN